MNVTAITIEYDDGTRQRLTVPASPPAPAPLPPLTNQSRLGVNLDSPNSSSTFHLFADAMRSARTWGLFDKPEDTHDKATGAPRIQLDADGFTTGPAARVVFVEQPAADGDYALRYETRTGWRAETVTVPAGDGRLDLKFPEPVRNVTLLRPGCKPGDVFTPAALAQMAPFGAIRCMDLLSTNGSTATTWESRLELPWHPEDCVALANVTGKNLWLCVPHAADDGYVRGLRALVEKYLRPDVECYVEYSNELVWNNIHPFNIARKYILDRTREALAAGDTTLMEADGKVNETNSMHRWVARRAVQIGQQLGPRCKMILANQNGYGDKPSAYGHWFRHQLNYISTHHGEPKQFLHALASAPYGGIGDHNPKPDHRKAIADLAHANGLLYATYEMGFHNTTGGQEMYERHVAPEAADAVQAYLDNIFADADFGFWFVLSSAHRVKPDGNVSLWGLAQGTHDFTSPKYLGGVRSAQKWQRVP